MMRESAMCLVLLLTGLIGCDSGQTTRLSFLDYIRPLSIKREKSLRGSDGLEKLPVLDFVSFNVL